MAKLIHRLAKQVVGEYVLKPGTMTVGRGDDNDVQLDDPTASGRHAAFSVEPSPFLYNNINDVYVEDLGSTNGTNVNGQKIQKTLLKHGDIAKIGEHEFTYIDEEKLRLEKTMIITPEDQT